MRPGGLVRLGVDERLTLRQGPGGPIVVPIGTWRSAHRVPTHGWQSGACHSGCKLNGLTWFLPGVAVSLVASRFLASRASDALHVGRWVAWLIVLSVGVIIAATLTPIRAPIGIDIAVGRPCDLARHWLASPTEIMAMSDVTLNVVVFLPLGFAVGWLPVSWRTAAVLAAAIALPPTIEVIQFLIPLLARGCQAADVADCLTGESIGLLAAVVVRLLRRKFTRAGPRVHR